jgi:HAD superfamily hydrolase (TIGR01549 family)
VSASSARDIDAITLDFYGTLAYHRDGRGRGRNLVDYLLSQGLRPAPWQHEILYDIFDRHDADYSPDLPRESKKRYLHSLAARVFERLDITAGDGLVQQHAPALWRILGPEAFDLFPETGSVVGALRDGGYPLALVSNWQHGLRHFVAELGLAGGFDHVISSAELGVAKPDRRIYDEACGRLGVSPERVIHVGDTLVDDYEGAASAGLRALLVHRGSEPAPAGVESIRDLRELLPRLGVAERGSTEIGLET